MNAYGTYSLLLIGENQITYTKTFSVFQNVYSFNGNKSSIDYGALNKHFSSSGYPYGLKLSLTEGDTFTFAKPVDLSKSKYQKLLMWNVNDIGKNPSVHSITVRVTDAYDPNNFFTITNSKGTYYYETTFPVVITEVEALALRKTIPEPSPLVQTITVSVQPVELPLAVITLFLKSITTFLII